jgi:DNA replication protein DnaC
MSIQQIQQKMERLKLNHTLPLISELFEEATKQKSSAVDFFENLLTLEVEAREESRIAASLKVSGVGFIHIISIYTAPNPAYNWVV